MNRRSFLGAILAAGAAPAIVRADSLMRVVVRPSGVLTWASYEFYVDHSTNFALPDWGYVERGPVWTDRDELYALMMENIKRNNAILMRTRAAKPFTGGYVVEGMD